MTLRAGVLCALGALVAAAIVVALTGHTVSWFFIIEAIIAAGLIVFERSRYRANRPATAPGFEPTGERFIDPASGRETTVYYNPVTGERDYRD
jgi:hypothetical protein